LIWKNLMTALRLLIAFYVVFAAPPLRAVEPIGPVMHDASAAPGAPGQDELPTPYGELPLLGTEGPDPNESLIEGYEPIPPPNWAASPYRRTGWRFGFMPGITDDGNEFILRANLGYEHADGLGKRAQLWLFNDDFGIGFNHTELWASTLYFDYYKRFYYNGAELLLGGGWALGHQNFELNGGPTNRFYGGGGSVVADGFLPFVDGKRSDLGAVARGRVGALAGYWDQQWGGDDFDDWFMLVEEFAWGLEYRQLFGKNDSHFWYLNVMRELHHWGGVELPYTSDTIIEGTAMNFGIAW
jgi:hypothetical protein